MSRNVKTLYINDIRKYFKLVKDELIAQNKPASDLEVLNLIASFTMFTGIGIRFDPGSFETVKNEIMGMEESEDLDFSDNDEFCEGGLY